MSEAQSTAALQALAASPEGRLIAEKVDAALQRLGGWYGTRSPGAKAIVAGLATVSVVGAPLLTYVAETATKAQTERILEFLEDLRQALDRLERAQRLTLDRTFVESEAYGELLITAFRAASRTHQREKLRTLALAFASAGLESPYTEAFKESALSLVADLREEHMRIIRVAADQFAARLDDGRPPPVEVIEDDVRRTFLARGAADAALIIERVPGLDGATTAALLADLRARGVFLDPTIGTWAGTQGDRGYVQLTPFGVAFVKFVTMSES